MKNFNVWRNSESSLETTIDERGKISDIFYDENINHVAIIASEPNSIRGNHYHKLTTQHELVIKGELEYWFKPLESEAAAETLILKEGDIVTTPPFEVHAFRFLSNNEFIVFSQGLRGGKDYENDTFRIDPPLVSDTGKL